MLQNDMLNYLRNRWVILTIFILLFPIAYEIEERMATAGLLDTPTMIIYAVTALLAFYFALNRWEDQ